MRSLLLPSAFGLLLLLSACDTATPTEKVQPAAVGTFAATHTSASGASTSIQGSVASSSDPSTFDGVFDLVAARDSTDCNAGVCEEVDVQVAAFTLEGQSGETLVLFRINETELASGTYGVTNDGPWLANDFRGFYLTGDPTSQANSTSNYAESGTVAVELSSDKASGQFNIQLDDGSKLEGTFTADPSQD